MGLIQFYPIDVVARTVNQKTSVILYGRSLSGDRIAAVDSNYQPYFYVLPKDADPEKLEQELSRLTVRIKDRFYGVLKVEKTQMKVAEKETQLFKVYVNNQFAMPYLAKELARRQDIEKIFEKDVSFLQSYLADRKIIPGVITEIQGEFVNKYTKVPLIRVDSISQYEDEMIPNPKVLAFDIETYSPNKTPSSPDKDPIIMISFHGENFQKTITWKKFETNNKNIEFVENELELLSKFRKVIDEFAPDFLAGYTSDIFGFPYLKKRADKHGIIFDIGVDKSIADITKNETSIKGIAHIDLYPFISKVIGSKLETDTYRLKEVAQELLGESKKIVQIELLPDVWDNHPHMLEPFCEYTQNDAYLIYKLFMKVAPMMNELVKFTSMPFFDVARSSFLQYAEAFMIRESRFAKELIPNRPFSAELETRKTVSLSNEVVLEAEDGLYNNLILYDVSLLYPSVVITHNISPGTLNCRCCTEVVPNEPMHFCKKITGFFPKILGNLFDRRKRITKMLSGSVQKTSQQMQILGARQEVLMNLSRSINGLLGFSSSRWFNEDCAKSMLAYERFYLNSITEKIKKAGFNVVCADTDTVFFRKGHHTKEECAELYESISGSLPEKIEIIDDGLFERGVFVSTKSGKSTKKRYALLSPKGFIKMEGFGSTRRHLSTIAKETQEKVLDSILREKNGGKALLHVRQIIDDLQNKKVPVKKTIIYTQLQKDIGNYETIAPHVAVAKKMLENGFTVVPGSIIRYIVSKGEGSISEKAKMPNEIEEYDSDYYINNQILSSVEKIFEAVGIDLTKALQDNEQSNLKEFI